ncbi:member of Set1p complex, histone methyl transferase [Entomortierella lignicola]|nr:member of Set1p complex, histone methyl transferase [Entomortierella lignicola]
MDYSNTNNNSSNNNSNPHQPSLHAQTPPPIVLTPALLGSLKVSKIFKDNTQIITSLDFDDTGAKCVTSAQDESLHVYDCITGKLDKTLFSKKYGVHLARFTHRSTNVVYASTKEDGNISLKMSLIPLAKQAINKCRCEFVFCDTHKATTKHDCDFDFAKMGKDLLTKNNPKLNDKPRGGRSFTRIQE